MIPVDYASHSAQVERSGSVSTGELATIVPRSGDVPFFSTVTGGLLDTAELDGEYWYRNLRETVQFERVTRALLGGGQRAFIEVSPHPVLTMGVQESVDETLEDPGDAVVVGSLRREQGGPERFLGSLAELWTHGVEVDWGALFIGRWCPEGHAADLCLSARSVTGLRLGWGGRYGFCWAVSADHPLLGAAVELADGGGWLFTGRLSLQSHPWLADHAVMGSVLLPGTAFLELALYAGEQVGCAVVRELTLEAPLLFSEHGAVQLQLSVGEPDETGQRSVGIYSRPGVALAAGSVV